MIATGGHTDSTANRNPRTAQSPVGVPNTTHALKTEVHKLRENLKILKGEDSKVTKELAEKSSLSTNLKAYLKDTTQILKTVIIQQIDKAAISALLDNIKALPTAYAFVGQVMNRGQTNLALAQQSVHASRLDEHQIPYSDKNPPNTGSQAAVAKTIYTTLGNMLVSDHYLTHDTLKSKYDTLKTDIEEITKKIDITNDNIKKIHLEIRKTHAEIDTALKVIAQKAVTLGSENPGKNGGINPNILEIITRIKKEIEILSIITSPNRVTTLDEEEDPYEIV